MTLATDEFIRRFLIHVLPKGFHRIRHYGLFARGACADNIARARELLAVAKPEDRAHRCRRRSQQADLSMLRRSHDHHRDLRARRNATASADSSNDRDQDRHLMTASQSRKSGSSCSLPLDRPRQSSPRYPATASQIVRQLVMFDAIRRSFISRFAVGTARCDRLDSNQPARPRHSNPHSACGTASRSPNRGFLPWRLSDAGRRIRGAVRHAAGIRNPSQQPTFAWD